MTVLSLILTLCRGLLSGRFRPGDLIVREWGDWDEDGSSNYKRVYFADARRLPEFERPEPEFGDGEIAAGRYGKAGTGPVRRLVKLD